MRKNHGSISSTDSGNSDAMSFCEGNVYHLTSSILHNAPYVPLPPRRHSAVQQGSTANSCHQHFIQPGLTSSKQGNGDVSSMPPPPNPRTRNASAGYNIYSPQQHQMNQQLRHSGELNESLCLSIEEWAGSAQWNAMMLC